MSGFSAPSTGRTVRAVLFDTFGTVVDWRSGVASAVRAFAADKALTLDPELFADAWRAQYEPAKERVRSGQRPYVSLDTLHRENLDTALRAHDIDPGTFAPDELTSLAAAWHFLPPWPDSVEGIRQIRRHFIVGPLSNGNTALLVDMAKAAGLPWDVILGSDISRAYKPSLDAYQKPADLLGLDPGEVMLAAAHNSDLEGARRAGLATAFIARPTEYGPHQATDLIASDNWDLTAESITDLASQLLDGSAARDESRHHSANSIGAYSVARVRYSFFVHRTAPRWRLVIAESGSFPGRTTPDQWQHSRDRAEADTNPDVRTEVQREGYCLFAISASFDELDRDLRSAGRG